MLSNGQELVIHISGASESGVLQFQVKITKILLIFTHVLNLLV